MEMDVDIERFQQLMKKADEKTRLEASSRGRTKSDWKVHKLPYWIDEDIVTKDKVHWRDESKMDNNVGVKREDSAKVERSSGLEGNSRFSLDDEIRRKR